MRELSSKKILLDTNILINCGREEFGLEFKKILRILADNKNSLAVSIISGFEILKKYRNDEKVINYYIKLLNYIQSINPDITTMNIAGMMASELDNASGGDGSKKDNDFIIGATVVRHTDSLLMTCDRKDFSSPFWDIVVRECIAWEDRECRKIENVFLLKFNYENWYKKYKDDFQSLAKNKE